MRISAERPLPMVAARKGAPSLWADRAKPEANVNRSTGSLYRAWGGQNFSEDISEGPGACAALQRRRKTSMRFPRQCAHPRSRSQRGPVRRAARKASPWECNGLTAPQPAPCSGPGRCGAAGPVQTARTIAGNARPCRRRMTAASQSRTALLRRPAVLGAVTEIRDVLPRRRGCEHCA